MSPHLSEQMFDTQAPSPALPSGEGATSLVQPEVLEAFRDREILAGCHLGGALPNRLLELSPIADLALVFAQRVDLQIKRLADLVADIRLVRFRQVGLFGLVACRHRTGE